MSDKPIYTQPPSHNKYTVEYQRLNLESGILGKFFGSSKSAASSISWIIIFLLTFSGIITAFYGCKIGATEYWGIVTPIITLALGYLFGRRGE